MQEKDFLIKSRTILGRLYKIQVFDLLLTTLVSMLGVAILLLSTEYVLGMLLGNIILFIAFLISVSQVKRLKRINAEKESIEYNLLCLSYRGK